MTARADSRVACLLGLRHCGIACLTCGLDSRVACLLGLRDCLHLWGE